MDRLIVGCGYVGRRVARRWIAEGDKVWGLVRSADRATQLQAEQIRPIVADVTDPGSLADLPPVQTVLYSVGYDPQSGRSRHDVYVRGLSHALAALPDTIERLVFLSSTGVYQESSASWITEETPAQPTRDAGRTFLAAEQLLGASRFGPKSIVLRAAGIYGPGRIVRRADIIAGRPIATPAAGCLNLIHVDDLAEVVVEVERQVSPPRMYLVSDGHPVTREQYYAYLAELLSAAPPRFVEPPAEIAAQQRGAGSKRICNTRLLSDLNLRLIYPDYREGLPASLIE